MKAGATHVTHLFNAMEPIRNRMPGTALAALLTEETQTELIADGNHLHPAMLELAFRMKGDDGVILISDSCRATGMPDGEYTLGDTPILKTGNRAVLRDRPDTLAGSVSNLYDCMVNCIRHGIPAKKAIRAATINPARSMGIEECFGSIEAGKTPGLLLVDGDWRLRRVL